MNLQIKESDFLELLQARKELAAIRLRYAKLVLDKASNDEYYLNSRKEIKEVISMLESVVVITGKYNQTLESKIRTWIKRNER